jgi:hypothetical protein
MAFDLALTGAVEFGMRNLRFFLACSGLLLAGNSLGCNGELPANCPKPLGVYKGQYSMIAGTCSPNYEPFSLKFQVDDKTNTSYTEKRLADVVITDILLKGCELKVGQRVTGEGAASGTTQTRSAIAGTLGVIDENQLNGTIERTDFMEDGQTVRCSAQYEAWYTRDDLLLGAAARD